MLLFRMDLEHISKECKYYDEINAAVKVLIDNGTTDELYAKWCE